MMGESKQRYCDGCKAAIDDVTFSQGDESGIVYDRIAVWKQTGSQVEGVSGDLCPACYTKLLNWFNTKKAAAATDWAVEPPDLKIVTPPTL
jgi:hypothetical protein